MAVRVTGVQGQLARSGTRLTSGSEAFSQVWNVDLMSAGEGQSASVAAKAVRTSAGQPAEMASKLAVTCHRVNPVNMKIKRTLALRILTLLRLGQ